MSASNIGWGRLAGLFLLVAACLGGCATQPTSTRTSVVLLPDEDNKVGAVSMSTASGTRLLDKAFSYTTVDGSQAAPSDARAISRGMVNTVYGALLKEQPLPPRTFVLNFVLDKTVLTEESKAMLPVIFAALRERKPGGITVFGHADATGTQDGNLRLSAERAEAVAQLLRTNDPTLGHIELLFFGDTRPLTTSAPRSPDARNRRVEILML